MAIRTLPFLRRRREPAAHVLAFVMHWRRQFQLYTRPELKAAAAAVADAYQAHVADRALATKFMLITTALRHCRRDFKPSPLKRFFYLPGDTAHCTRQFLAAPLPLPDSVSDALLLSLVGSRRQRRYSLQDLQAPQDAEPARQTQLTE